jgi:ABC-type sugar transport system ATPase subunit
MEPRTLIKAEIRGIDVHLIQIDTNLFQTNWCRWDANIKHLRTADRDMRWLKAVRQYGIKVDVFYEPDNTLTSFEIAARQFHEICRAAQNKNIKFE